MSLKIGQKVQISGTTKVGTIKGLKEGKWVIAVDGDEVLKETTDVEELPILLG